MFDTMTVTKIIGGFCGAFLIFLLGAWAAEELYHVGHGGHGEEHSEAYPIEVAESGDTGEVEEGPDFATVLAEADPADGEGVFRKCVACHSVAPGENKTGPHLAAVVGRAIGSVDGFGYSGALADMEGDWTPEALSDFLENPKGFAPGTAMSFAGLKKIDDRADLIAYLQTLN